MQNLKVILQTLWLWFFWLPCVLISSEENGRLLFLLQTGEIDQALTLYENDHRGKDDPFLLRQIGLSLLQQGSNSSDQEVQLLTMLGIGISLDEQTIPILEQGLRHKDPNLQLVCLHQLARMHHVRADAAIKRSMTSSPLPIALEAAALLTQKHPNDLSAILEVLLVKIPKPLTRFFPAFFASLPDPRATRNLRKLLNHSDEAVRLASLQSIVRFRRDDLLLDIRKLLLHPSSAIQEAAAATIGELGDTHSANQLQALTGSLTPAVKLAALFALYQLGSENSAEEIEALAKSGNCYAIRLLGKMGLKKELLYANIKSCDPQVAANAAYGLLELGDTGSLEFLANFLVKDRRDLALIDQITPGGTLHAWRVVHSAKVQLERLPFGTEIELRNREEIIRLASRFEEPAFLSLADKILSTPQHDLIPGLVLQLEQLETDAAIQLLQKYTQSFGEPCIRQWCALALYRLHLPGPHGERLRAWLQEQEQLNHCLVQFRPLLPLEHRELSSQYDLTAHERSRLILESFEAFIISGDRQGILTLIQALHHGEKRNRYLLAAILMRASQ